MRAAWGADLSFRLFAVCVCVCVCVCVVACMRCIVVLICTITMSVRNQPKIYEVKRHSNERHTLFCFISFIGIYYPLTDIVIVHIVYINETNS